MKYMPKFLNEYLSHNLKCLQISLYLYWKYFSHLLQHENKEDYSSGTSQNKLAGLHRIQQGKLSCVFNLRLKLKYKPVTLMQFVQNRFQISKQAILKYLTTGLLPENKWKETHL